MHVVPNSANIRNLGASDRRWNTVYSQYLDVSGTVSLVNLTVNGNLTVTGNTIQIGNIVTDTKTIQLANTAGTANAANGSGITVGANDNIATLLYNSTSNVWTTNIGLSSVGNITAPYFFGNGSQLTGLPATYGNSNVVAYGESGWAGNIIPNGNAVYSLGNATNQWNDLYVSNATIFMNNVPISLSAGNVLTVNGNAVLQNNSNTTISTTGNVTSGNVLTGGIVSATGNVTGNYFIGNGSQLTGLPATYGNANVATFLASFGSNTISSTGNVTAGNIIVGNVVGSGNAISISVAGNIWQFSGITGNATIPPNGAIRTATGTGGNIVLHPDGTGIVVIQGAAIGPLLLLTSDTAGSNNRIEIDTIGNSSTLGAVYTGKFARGNINSAAAVQAGDRLTSLKGSGYDGTAYAAVSAQITIEAFDTYSPGNTPSQISFWTQGYGNVSPQVNMRIAPTGNVDIYNGNLIMSGGGGYLQGNTVTGNDALYAGSANFVPLGSNVVAQFGANSNSYSQINFQNINNGTLASADYILTANNGTDTTYFVDLGITGNNHSDSAFFGDTSTANDAYLYVVGADATGPGGSGPGNLILGSTNGTIKMFVGNTAQANVIATVDSSGLVINTGNLVLPQGGIVYETNIPDGGLSGSAIALKPTGGTNADQ
ncbi:MAG: beta strand repeat-containing protein, partial [Terrimicrobiaceae bacterium]